MNNGEMIEVMGLLFTVLMLTVFGLTSAGEGSENA
tara:strand:- start:24729 stop:24833 length:105 start_codon:yes stop_codon:yes gene_type:complete